MEDVAYAAELDALNDLGVDLEATGEGSVGTVLALLRQLKASGPGTSAWLRAIDAMVM